uniref:Ig-like domain-containing protein n=2 Tax=Canis lupus familiaris TaxID=9615 RepID=A0A8C0PK13_CANLF
MTPTLMSGRDPSHRTLPKPTIWAEPGSVIPWRTPVTLWCQGSLEAKVYRLHRERQSVTWDRQESLEPKDKAKFSITHMTGVYAGQYYCYYGSTTEWPEPSDSLELPSSHLGLHGKPNLSVLPSPVVPSGGHVTLQCDSWTGFRRSVLMKEGQCQHPWTQDSYPRLGSLEQTSFPLGPVRPFHRSWYPCYGEQPLLPVVGPQ